MSFFSEAGAALGLDYAKLLGGYHYINYNGEAVYIEGIKRICSISDERIVCGCKTANIAVKGKMLAVKQVDKGSAIIVGAISSVEVAGNE